MAKGWDGIEQQTAATVEARQRAQESFLPELKVNQGQHNQGPFQIRFGEQGTDVNNYGVHEYKVPAQFPGGFRIRRFTCLKEQPYNGERCPGCEAGMKLKRRGVYNVIQRNRPVFRRGADKKAIKNPDGSYIIDGYQDEVVVANVGGPTAEMLRKADGQYRGLMSRDFVVVYSGDTFQAWNLSPVLDDQGNANAMPLTENDQALLATKHDLDAYMRPPSFEEALRIVQQYGGNSGVQTTTPGQPQASPPQGNAGHAGAPNGFLQGANIPPATQAPGSAFGAAQQAVAPPSVPAAAQPQHPAAPTQYQQPAPGAPQPPAAPAPAPSPVQQ